MRNSPGMRSVHDACRREDAPERLDDAFGAFLDEHGVEGTDRDALDAIGPTKMLAYRKMVHSRLRRCLTDLLPRTSARLGPRLRTDLAAFLAGPASRARVWTKRRKTAGRPKANTNFCCR